MSRRLPFVVIVLAAAGFLPVALGEDDPTEFRRFDHSKHERALARQGVSCVACHQVGATADGPWGRDRLADTFLQPPDGACHQCHAPGQGGLGAGRGMNSAPGTCATCHDRVEAPVTHEAGWLATHGQQAAFEAASCRDCHSRSTCVECHDRRENVSRSVHDAAWLTVHGIVARASPAGCDTCHAQSECTSCHGSAAGFGRTQ